MTGILPIRHKTKNNQSILDKCKLRYWYVPFYFSAINSQLIWRNDVHVHLIHELNTTWHHLFNFQQQKFSLLVNPLTTKMLFLLITWTNNPTQECFTHMETSPLRVKSCTFWPMLNTRPLSSEGSLPCLLGHGASVNNGNPRGPVTHTPIAKRLAVELSIPVFTASVCRGWDSNTQPFACEATTR